METASVIAKEIGVEELHVNYRVAEWLDIRYYPVCNPIPFLIINNIPEDEFRTKFIQGIKFNHNTEFRDVMACSWPESYNSC